MLVPVCLPASGGHGPIITPPAVGTGDSLHGRSSCCGAVTLAASAVPARGSLTRHTGAAGVFATLTGGPARRNDDLAVLTTATLAFALGADTVEGTKHLRRAEAGAAVGLAMVPQLATLRARLSALADTSDPLALQRAVAAAMLSADPAADPVYFVDDHFVPYSGARPVGKGWNTKRRHAQPGRADTLPTHARGRAVVFGSGEPSGLTSTLPG